MSYSHIQAMFNSYVYGKNTKSKVLKMINDLYDPNGEVWVKVTDSSSSRFGSIGRAYPANVRNRDDPKEWAHALKLYQEQFTYYSDKTYFHKPNIVVEFDKGRKLPNEYGVNSMVDWLEDYSGGYVWNFKRNVGASKLKVQPVDRLGNNVNVGDLVVYSKKEYSRPGNTLYFGTVKKITRSGMCYCENIKLNENDSVSTTRIQQSHGLTKLYKEIFSDLTLLKLQY